MNTELKPKQFTEEQLEEYYMSLNSDGFDIVCKKTKKKLEQIDNKFVEDVLSTCWNSRKITFKQFKVLVNFITNVIPEYRDFS
jgi:hypothetical protein